MYTKTFYTVENADSSDTATIFGTCFFLSKKIQRKYQMRRNGHKCFSQRFYSKTRTIDSIVIEKHFFDQPIMPRLIRTDFHLEWNRRMTSFFVHIGTIWLCHYVDK